MGMFDELSCKMPLPDDRVKPGSVYQTKSLECCLLNYTINEQGRLIFNHSKYEKGPDREIRPGFWLPTTKSIHLEDIDTEYHGDILFGATAKDGSYVEYVARFTHGAVEWIRPLEQLSDMHKSWLSAKE